LETKIAIIERKAALRGKEIPHDIVHFLAGEMNTNIRELEGAVLKLIAFSGLHNQPIDRALCKRALKELFDKPGQVSISDIMAAIATHFHLRVQDLQGKARHQAVARARQIAMFIARKLTPLSLEEIGGHFGGRDHTTVLYAEQRIREMTKESESFKGLIDRLVGEITRDGQARP
ncbi:MAG: helix-turn-helix domain-containing protein, partial [Polyangiaceae bacterium]